MTIYLVHVVTYTITYSKHMQTDVSLRCALPINKSHLGSLTQLSRREVALKFISTSAMSRALITSTLVFLVVAVVAVGGRLHAFQSIFVCMPI